MTQSINQWQPLVFWWIARWHWQASGSCSLSAKLPVTVTVTVTFGCVASQQWPSTAWVAQIFEILGNFKFKLLAVLYWDFSGLYYDIAKLPV